MTQPHPTYHAWVGQFAALHSAPLPAPRPPAHVPPAETNQPVALILAPHPDDEIIMGALPLRWQVELGWRVRVVAMTLGSNPSRQEARRSELAHACGLLGWDLDILGWDHVGKEAHNPQPDRIDHLKHFIDHLRPQAVFFPHPLDAHPVHQGVHRLAQEAVALSNARPAVYWTEFWHPMESPNLLVEVSPPILASLVEALACHAGEISRNPYHRTLPAWMMDNVRRGAERISGTGCQAPEFPFGVLYRTEPAPPQPILPASPPNANPTLD
ncbi:MAG: hypothetical protein OHK005_06440 [Candidatus Methylacidiphilales bacterium]